jgi:hypothetical protein
VVLKDLSPVVESIELTSGEEEGREATRDQKKAKEGEAEIGKIGIEKQRKHPSSKQKHRWPEQFHM